MLLYFSTRTDIPKFRLNKIFNCINSRLSTNTLTPVDINITDCFFLNSKTNQLASQYPANPNGSLNGVTGLCSDDGGVTIMMPHPERVFRSAQFSWCPDKWLESDDSPWMRMFYNASMWCREN